MKSAAAITDTEASSLPHKGAEFFGRLAHNIIAEPPDIREYFKEAWQIIEPARPLVFGWHIGAILEHLQAIELFQIRNLLLTLPPRNTKSIAVSVVWPTWSWTTSPWLRYIGSSYSAGLAIKHNVDRRDLIRSSWYRKNWGDVVRLKDDQDQKQLYSNTARGHMIAMGIGGTVTGLGCDREVIDDLINPEMAESEAEREAAIRFYDNTLCTRLDDKEHGVKVAVLQRTHRKDLAGHILEMEPGEWTHLNLPAEAPKKIVIILPISGTRIVREQGDALSPERESKAELARVKQRNIRVWNAQYQQDPSSDDSDFFNRSWWGFYKPDAKPAERRSAWGWDTAVKEGNKNDYSAGFRIAECEDNKFYVSPRRFMERVAYPVLKQSFKNEVTSNPADMVAIEDKSSGQQLIQDMQHESTIAIIPIREGNQDKVFWASLVSPTVQGKKVMLPEGEPWVADFVEKMQNFPDVDFDDDCDAFVNAMLVLLGKTKYGIPQVFSA